MLCAPSFLYSDAPPLILSSNSPIILSLGSIFLSLNQVENLFGAFIFGFIISGSFTPFVLISNLNSLSISSNVLTTDFSSAKFTNLGSSNRGSNCLCFKLPSAFNTAFISTGLPEFFCAIDAFKTVSTVSRFACSILSDIFPPTACNPPPRTPPMVTFRKLSNIV